jgi:hypothetical protein
MIWSTLFLIGSMVLVVEIYYVLLQHFIAIVDFIIKFLIFVARLLVDE